MTLRMYAASRAPRLSMTTLRKASSSTPIASMSSGVRWASALGRPDFLYAGRGGRTVSLVTDRRGSIPRGLLDACCPPLWCTSVGEMARRSGARVMGVVLPVSLEGSVVGCVRVLELDVTRAGDGVYAGLDGQ